MLFTIVQDFATLSGGKDIKSDPQPTNGQRGWKFANMSPYFFALTNDKSEVIDIIGPWDMATGVIREATTNLVASSIVAMPKHDLATATTSGEWRQWLELSNDPYAPTHTAIVR